MPGEYTLPPRGDSASSTPSCGRGGTELDKRMYTTVKIVKSDIFLNEKKNTFARELFKQERIQQKQFSLVRN